METHHARQGAPIALIVEDDPHLRELAAALLEETDLRVIECEDAEQAFGILCREGDDVAMIFVDIRLPGVLDGMDLARRVRALRERESATPPGVPLIRVAISDRDP